MGGNQGIMTILWMAAMFVVVYFFFMRPQSEKAKKEKLFVDEIEKGDKVVTTQGIHGIIDRVEDTSFMLEIDKNVKVRIEKSSVSADLTKAIYPKGDDKK
jgi:preprotein translocase subunit YajC